MELVPKVGELDGVLDEDRVVLRAGDERPLLAKDQLVVLHRAPRMDLADCHVPILVRLVRENASSGLGAVTLKNAI